ncbi:MAG: hypothetical protein ABF697_00605 [Zymomonas mobilis]|uniref:hypothetical protein n=1 Tax=Zymomonas mobilis TaxID=542 RepID=UPI0039EBBFF3
MKTVSLASLFLSTILMACPLYAQSEPENTASLPLVAGSEKTHRAVDYVGGWAVTSNGKTIMEIQIEQTHDSKNPFAGFLSHPHLDITPKAFTKVHGPLVREEIIASRFFDDHLFFSTRDGLGARHDIEMWLDNNESASLNILDIAGIRWPITRTNSRAPFTLNWDINHVYTIDRPELPPNTEIIKLYHEVQPLKNTDEELAGSARIQRVKDIITQGKLHTAQDFNQAAYILNRSSRSEDALFAHSLAMAALANGDETAITTATNSLDHYLMLNGRPQIYGTCREGSAKNSPIKQPYDNSIIPETLRHELGAFEPIASLAPSTADKTLLPIEKSNETPGKEAVANTSPPTVKISHRKIPMGQPVVTKKIPAMPKKD